MNPQTSVQKFETWLPVVGFDGLYEVSNTGLVRSLDRQKMDTIGRNQRVRARQLIPQKHRGGYLAHQLWRDNKMKRPLLHSIVAEAFIGPRPGGYDINHIDGNKLNNHVENLEYVTRSGNMHHAYEIGILSKGQNSPVAKLTEMQVREIRKLNLEQGLGCRKLSRQFCVSKETISSILNGKNWKHLL